MPSFSAQFVDALRVERAAVSTLSVPFEAETLSASDEIAARIVELELDTGEGPCWDAFRTQGTVLVPRLDDVSSERWPAFSRGVAELPVGAICSLPLTIGALQIGAVDLYAGSADDLTPDAVAAATDLAGSVAAEVLEYALRRRHTGQPDDGPFSRREVHQATGMVIAQLHIAAPEALLLIRAHAYASGRTVREVAADITSRRLTLEL